MNEENGALSDWLDCCPLPWVTERTKLKVRLLLEKRAKYQEETQGTIELHFTERKVHGKFKRHLGLESL